MGSLKAIMKTNVLQVALLFLSSCSANESITKPNIVFIMADDLGWNDIGYHGMTEIPTPNIDALAADGIVLSHYYTAAQCSPSRSALLTGRYPSRLGLQSFVIPSFGPWGLPLHFETLANKLGDLGYVNRLVGKWHMGFYKSEFLPTCRGFHSHFGFWTAKIDYFHHDEERSEQREKFRNVPANITDDSILLSGHALRCNRDEVQNLTGRYLTDILTEEATKIISTHNMSMPLFLLLAHHAPHRGSFHRPTSAPEEYTKNFPYIKNKKNRVFAGAVQSLDDSVGKVMAALYNKGMLDNTIVIFNSDNGADTKFRSVNQGSNWPLRGQKFSPWEGGVRVPSLIWSPLLPNPGRVWNGLAHITDWFPTLYNLAGGDQNGETELDGHDLWNAIAENKTSPRTEILIFSDSFYGIYALRVGKYKLLKGPMSLEPFPFRDSSGWYGDERRTERVVVLDKPQSVVEEVLNNFRGENRKNLSLKVQVNCGVRSSDPDHACDLENNVCLFDVEEDPCEYRNIARSHTQVVEALTLILEEHISKDVEPLNTEFDYLANPALHGNSWSPWQDPPGRLEELVPPCETRAS